MRFAGVYRKEMLSRKITTNMPTFLGRHVLRLKTDIDSSRCLNKLIIPAATIRILSKISIPFFVIGGNWRENRSFFLI